MEQMIFVNLPVSDLDRSRAFYAAIGAANDPQFSDASTAMMSFSRAVNVMIMTHARFSTFTSREIVDAHLQAQVLLSLSRESRAAVDKTVEQAAAAGGVADPSPRDEIADAMYGRSFSDPDGHIWGVMWMDAAAMLAAVGKQGAIG